MNELINTIISTIIQIWIFALIPFIFFLFRKDKNIKFGKYLWLYKAWNKSYFYVILVILLFLIFWVWIIFLDNEIKNIVLSENSVTWKLRELWGWFFTVIIIFIIAFFKTALAEEILFRWFLTKRFIYLFGFNIWNFLQAIIFGLVHFILFYFLVKTSFIALIMVFCFSSFAWFMNWYINEKKSNWSIFPGILAHGIGNFISYLIIVLLI